MDRNTRRLGGGRACLCQVGALLALGWNRCGGCVRTSCLLFHGQDQVIFFSRDAEDAVQAQPKNVPKIAQFYPLKFLKLWLETRHRRHH